MVRVGEPQPSQRPATNLLGAAPRGREQAAQGWAMVLWAGRQTCKATMPSTAALIATTSAVSSAAPPRRRATPEPPPPARVPSRPRTRPRQLPERASGGGVGGGVAGRVAAPAPGLHLAPFAGCDPSGRRRNFRRRHATASLELSPAGPGARTRRRGLRPLSVRTRTEIRVWEARGGAWRGGDLTEVGRAGPQKTPAGLVEPLVASASVSAAGCGGGSCGGGSCGGGSCTDAAEPRMVWRTVCMSSCA